MAARIEANAMLSSEGDEKMTLEQFDAMLVAPPDADLSEAAVKGRFTEEQESAAFMSLLGQQG